MLFSSFTFLFFFFPIVFSIALRLRGSFLLWWIALVSCVFYAMNGELWFLLPMGFTVVLDFLLAPRIARAQGKKRTFFLLVSITSSLGLLFYFKYLKLGIRSALILTRWLTGTSHMEWLQIPDILLPPGISFYTFQTLSYVFSVSRGAAAPEKSFSRFAAFISFFPHLVAGPITRHNQLIPQLNTIAAEGIKPRWQEGAFLFSIGLCKKVLIADRIGHLIDPILRAPQAMSTAWSWLTLLGFGLQIYFDFSGYSDMAIGLGRLLGVELPQNFNSPFQSKNPIDFWKRWHISLGNWIREYLFNPLAMAACRRSQAFMPFVVLFTMLLFGLWHGAGLTFALFGLYHGVLMLLYYINRRYWDRAPGVLQGLGTFVLMLFGFLFFRSRDISMVEQWVTGLAGGHGQGALVAPPPDLLFFLAAGLIIVLGFPNASSFKGFGNLRPSLQFGLATLVSLAILLMNFSSSFIYFQF